MKSFIVSISFAASLLILLAIVGALPARSDIRQSKFKQQSEDRVPNKPFQKGAKPLSYRSPGAAHKLMLPADDPQLEQLALSSRSPHKSKKYDSYSLVEVSDAELNSLDNATLERAQLRDDLNLVMLKRGQIDTTGLAPIIANDLRQPQNSTPALHLVQLFGPPTPESRQALTR